MEKVKIGVIGCGVVASRDILPNLVQPEIRDKGIELVAVCDLVENRAREAMETFRAKEMYTDYKDMLDSSDINAVFILTPIGSHYGIAINSALACKHIYVQKTMTTTLEEANNLLSTVKKRGVKLVASPGQMHNSSLRIAKEMLDKDLIGKPMWGYIFANNDGHLSDPTDPAWYYKPGGGPVYSFLVYSVTNFCWLLGSVKKVTSLSGIAIPTRFWRRKRIDVKMDDSTMILMDFGNSIFVSAISNFCVKGVMANSALYGTKGVIRIPLSALRSTQQTSMQALSFNITRKIKDWKNSLTSSKEDWVEWRPPLFSAQYRLAAPTGANIVEDILEFIECVRHSKEPIIATGEHARHVIEVFEKSYIAAKTGQVQTLETSF